MNEVNPYDEFVADAPPAPPTPDTVTPSPNPMSSGGDHPLKTSVQVREPDGAPAPVDAGHPQATPTPVNPYDSVVEDDESKRLGDITAFRAANQDMAPAKQVELMKYSEAAGLPISVTQDHLEELKKTVDQRAISLALQKAPGVQKLIESMDVPLAKDDIHTLSNFEWLLSGKWEMVEHNLGTDPFGMGLKASVSFPEMVLGPGWMRALRDSYKEQTDVIPLQYKAATTGIDKSEEAHLSDMERQYTGKDYGAESWLGKAFVGSVKMLPYMAGQVGSTAAGGAVGGPGGAVAGDVAFNYYQAVGPAYRELAKLQNQDGTPLLTDQQARTYAAGQASLTAALMSVPFFKFASKVPFIKNAFAGAAEHVVAKALTESTFPKTIAKGILAFGQEWGHGTLMMSSMAGAASATQEAARAEEGKVFHEYDTMKVLNDTGSAVKQAGTDMFFMSLVGPGMEFLHDVGQTKAIKENAQQYAEASKRAAESKLLERSPEDFEKFGNALPDAPPVHINAEAWNTYFQGKKLNPGEVFNHVAGADKAGDYAQALAQKADLVIPAGTWHAKMAKTEHGLGLANDIRLDPKLPSVNQARESFKRIDDAAVGSRDEASNAVYDHWREQALGAGESKDSAEATAAMVAKAYQTLSAKTELSGDVVRQKLMNVYIHGADYKAKLKTLGEDVNFDFGANVAQPVEAPQANALHQEARDTISRMRDDNRQLATQWMDYSTGKTEERPTTPMPPEMEKKLASMGVVDPAGYSFDEGGRSLSRPIPGKKSFGEEPFELRKQRIERQAHAEGRVAGWNEYSQPNKADIPEASRFLAKRLESRPSGADRADDLYRDHATGLLNEAAFRETPQPEGSKLAYFEFGNVKAVNDHPLHGGHEIADGVYRLIGNKLAQEHPQVFKLGGRLAAYVSGAKEMSALVKKVNEGVNDKAFRVVGSIGDSGEEAFKNINEAKDAARLAGEYPERDKMSPDLEARLPTLALPNERAQPAISEALIARAGKATRGELERAYIEPETGVLNSKGWNLIPRKKFVASIDVRGLKAANDIHGHTFGDRILRHFAMQAADARGSDFDFAHRSGDEYLAQSDDKEALVRHLEDLRSALQETVLPIEISGAGEQASFVVQFRHGIGDGEHAELAADRALNQQRADEKAGRSGVDSRGDERAHPQDGGEVRDRRGGVRSSLSSVGPEEVIPNGPGEAATRAEDQAALEVGSRGGLGEGQAPGDSGQRTPDLGAGAVSPLRGRARPQGFGGESEASGVVQLNEDGVTLHQPVWHGTPHTNFEKFSMEHIGTGEGAQVYGHGLYFAGKQATGEYYRDQLSQPFPMIDERKLDTFSPAERTAMHLVMNARANLGRGILPFEKALPEAIAKLEKDIATRTENLRHSAEGSALRERSVRAIEDSKAGLEVLKGLTPDRLKEAKGALFHVDIPDNHELLDYNATLDKQPPSVIAKLEDAGLLPKGRKIAQLLGDYLSSKERSGAKFDELLSELHKHHEGSDFLPNGERFDGATKGRDIYRAISEAKGGQEAASAALNEAGIPGLRYLDSGSRADGTGSHNYVIWDDARVKTLNKYESTDRGNITFKPPEAGENQEFHINLSKLRDKSTLPHETMHALSHIMGEIASADGASPELKADYSTLLEHMGHGTHEERQANLAEVRDLSAKQDRTAEEDKRLTSLVAKEERVTHAWEQYLMEGKAPSADLAGVFARFKNWMTRIYRGVTRLQSQFKGNFGEDIGLTDEVRGVFDRLLASQDEIAQAQKSSEAAQPFQAALEHMTDEEKQRYNRLLVESKDAAETDLLRRIVKSTRLENAKFAREEKARIRTEVSDELDKQPAYRALRFLQDGDLPDSPGETPFPLQDGNGKPLKLDRALVDREVAKSLPAGVFAGKGETGVSPDVIADLLGWNDGHEMLQSLGATRPRAEVVAEETSSRLKAQYPSLLEKPSALAREALDAVDNASQAKKVEMELNAMRRAFFADEAKSERAVGRAADQRVGELGKEQRANDREAEQTRRQMRQEISRGFDMAGAKVAAGELISGKSVGDLTSGERGLAGSYQRAERQAAKRATDAAAKGDLLTAFTEKRRQLFNQVLGTEARRVREELESGLKRLQGSGKDAWREALGKADPSYRDGHDAILQASGLQATDPNRSGLSLDPLLKQAEGDYQTVAFDVDGIRQLLQSPRAWGELTASEAGNVVDAVRNIRHMANDRNELIVEGKRQTADAFFDDLGKAAAANNKPLPQDPYSRTAAEKGVFRKVGGLLRGLDAMLSTTETLAALLDGEGNRNGPAHRLLVDGRLEARDKELQLQKKILEPLLKAFNEIPKDIKNLRDKTLDVDLPVPTGSEDRFSKTWTRDQLWSLFLNYGNEGNRQRLRDGNGWDGPSIEKELAKLSKPEADFLQKVLDVVESIYPELAAAHERRTGLPLGKVEATPITINGVEYRGGYFPLKYDDRINRQGKAQAADIEKALYPQGYVSPTVAAGHRKGRVEKVQAAVDLSWGVVPSHLSSVIRDVAYGDWVRQAGRIMLDRDGRFDAITDRYLGNEYTKQFVPWLRDVANARADSMAAVSHDALGEVAGVARGKLAVGVMGFSMAPLMAHVVDPFTSMTTGIRPDKIVGAYGRVAMELTRNLFGLDVLRTSDAPYGDSKELAYRDAQHQGTLKKVVSEMGPRGASKKVWSVVSDAAFFANAHLDYFNDRVLFEAGYEQALSEGKTKDEAVKFADDTVRKNLPVSDLGDKSAILRKKSGIAQAVMFYGYANKMYNLGRRGFNDGVAKGIAKLIVLSVVGTGAGVMAGRGPKQDEDKATWLATHIALDPLGTIPWIKGIAESFVTGKPVSIRNMPELAFLQDTLNRYKAAISRADSGDESTQEKLISGAAAIFGAMGPVSQAKRTGDFAKKVVSGESQPRGPGDVASGLIYGEKDNQPTNPFTAAQDLYSGPRN